MKTPAERQLPADLPSVPTEVITQAATSPRARSQRLMETRKTDVARIEAAVRG